MSIAFIQCKNTVLSGCLIATPGTSLGLSITPTLGNFLAGFVTWGSATLSDLTSITDNGTGGTWVIQDKTADGTNLQSGAFIFGYGWSVVPTIVTMNTANLSCLGIVLAEFSGQAAGNPLDGTNHQAQLQASGGAGTDGIKAGSGTITPGANNYLIVCCSINSANLSNGSSTFTAGTNYTIPTNGEHLTNNELPFALEYWIQTTATANSGTFTAAQNATTAFITFMAVFKVSGGAVVDNLDWMGKDQVYLEEDGKGIVQRIH